MFFLKKIWMYNVPVPFFLKAILRVRWLSGKEPACQCRRCEFDPWVGKILWKRKQQPTPIFLLGKSHGQRSLVGYSPWGHKEVDMTEWLALIHLSSIELSLSLIKNQLSVFVCIYIYTLYSVLWSVCSFTDATLSWWWYLYIKPQSHMVYILQLSSTLKLFC